MTQNVVTLDTDKYTILEAVRGLMITTNVVMLPKDQRYDIISERLSKLDPTPYLSRNNFTYILSYFDETRCYESFKAIFDFIKRIHQDAGITNIRYVAIVSDLNFLHWETKISEYNECEIVYVSYHDKVSLFDRYNLLDVRSQSWHPSYHKVLYLCGHLMHVAERLKTLFKVQKAIGKDNVKYTLNIPDKSNPIWKQSDSNYEYLSKYATSIGDCQGITYDSNCQQFMGGMDMPGDIYNDCVAQVLPEYSKFVLTEKIPRAMINDMPVVLGCNHVDTLDYEIYRFEHFEELPGIIDQIKTNFKHTEEVIAYNKNLLNSRGEHFYRLLNNTFKGDLDKLILQGKLFNHAT